MAVVQRKWVLSHWAGGGDINALFIYFFIFVFFDFCWKYFYHEKFLVLSPTSPDFPNFAPKPNILTFFVILSIFFWSAGCLVFMQNEKFSAGPKSSPAESARPGELLEDLCVFICFSFVPRYLRAHGALFPSRVLPPPPSPCPKYPVGCVESR